MNMELNMNKTWGKAIVETNDRQIPSNSTKFTLRTWLFIANDYYRKPCQTYLNNNWNIYFLYIKTNKEKYKQAVSSFNKN